MTKPNGIYDGITPEKTDQMYVDLGICLDCGCQVQSDKCCKNKQDGNPLSTYGKQLIADAQVLFAHPFYLDELLFDLEHPAQCDCKPDTVICYCFEAEELEEKEALIF